MPDLKPNEKTFWDAAFLAALQGMIAATDEGDNYPKADFASAYAKGQATAATLARRKVWEDVK